MGKRKNDAAFESLIKMMRTEGAAYNEQTFVFGTALAPKKISVGEMILEKDDLLFAKDLSVKKGDVVLCLPIRSAYYAVLTVLKDADGNTPTGVFE